MASTAASSYYKPDKHAAFLAVQPWLITGGNKEESHVVLQNHFEEQFGTCMCEQTPPRVALVKRASQNCWKAACLLRWSKTATHRFSPVGLSVFRGVNTPRGGLACRWEVKCPPPPTEAACRSCFVQVRVVAPAGNLSLPVFLLSNVTDLLWTVK